MSENTVTVRYGLGGWAGGGLYLTCPRGMDEYMALYANILSPVKLQTLGRPTGGWVGGNEVFSSVYGQKNYSD